MLFQVLPIRFKNVNLIINKINNKFFENQKFDKTKMNRWNMKNYDFFMVCVENVIHIYCMKFKFLEGSLSV